MASTRIERLDQLVKELSHEDDPDRLIRLFSRDDDLLWRRDGLLAVSARDLTPPQYRITRSWRRRDTLNPWIDGDGLPIFDRGLLSDLLYAGKPVLLDQLRVSADDPAREHLEGMRSLAGAPGYDHGRPIGMVVLLRREPAAFTELDMESLLLNANLINRAANNMLLAQRLQEAYRRLDDEMHKVGKMQRSLLPARLPRLDGLELAASYVTSSQAGGDYYDVLPLPGGRWGLFVADVSGHGVTAAMVMTMLHTLLHAFPGDAEPPLRVMAHLNQHLLAVAPEGVFATAFYGVYDPPRRRLRYAVAGHPPPRLRRGLRGVGSLETGGGLPLGVLPEETWAEREVTLTPGDVLLLCTDGILEGTNEAGTPFGRERLDGALRLAPLRAASLVHHVERLYKDFCGGAPQLDDRTLLAAVAVP